MSFFTEAWPLKVSFLILLLSTSSYVPCVSTAGIAISGIGVPTDGAGAEADACEEGCVAEAGAALAFFAKAGIETPF